eukprot:Rhum_TRINITY_DN6301_c0_g1::Rhum_TRINITY_DN6301_c0_g1_i1::g.19683::m.19683
MACCPSRDEMIRTLKQLGSAAIGMVGALALNEALKETAKEIFGDSSRVVYAIIVSILSIFVLAVLKLKLEAKAQGGERAKALIALFKVSFCLLSASAWQDVIEGGGVDDGDVWVLLGVALALTVGLIIILILVFKLYDFWKQAACKQSMHWIPSGFINGTLVGLVMWIPITFGFVNGMAWNAFFEALILAIFGTGAGRVVAAFVYALLTVPLAIGVILLTNKVKESGWGSCCPGCLAQPCCGLENHVSDPLAAMFEGEVSALMAFAWNSAFRALWSTISGDSNSGSDAPRGELWVIIMYAVVATIVGVGAVLLSKRCISP